MDDTQRIEQALVATTYADLFERLVPQAQDDLVHRPGAMAALHTIVGRAASPMHARFLAAELLFAREPGFPAGDAAAALPPIYAWALANHPTGNLWGLPGDDDGQAGTHVVRLGAPMVPALVPLFADERRLPFAGSIEATAAELWQVRVKDIAAALVARILHHQPAFPKQADRSVRDTYIQDLAHRAR